MSQFTKNIGLKLFKPFIFFIYKADITFFYVKRNKCLTFPINLRLLISSAVQTQKTPYLNITTFAYMEHRSVWQLSLLWQKGVQ